MERNPCNKKYSTLGAEKIPFYEYAYPEKCQNVDSAGVGCTKSDYILYPHDGKRYCFFCWSHLKYYSDDFGFEKGKQTIIGKKIVKKNAFYSKAESLHSDKKIEDIEWNDFKTLYVTDKKKARRYIKRVFKARGL